MSFNQDVKRIGFCCKYMHEDQSLHKKLLEEIQRPINTRGTTISWLRRQDRDVAYTRLWELMEHNIQSIANLIEYTGTLPDGRRMVRISSDILPAYTEPNYVDFWRRTDVRAYAEKAFGRVGEMARQKDVRVSFHPGQFCVLASDRPDVVERSIEEFEYHADMARWMGYGKQFMDMKINVHISGKRGPQGIIDILPRLSPEALNTISIENDEMCWGLDASMELADHVALVLDIHHHWIRDEEYIQADDDRVKRVIDSWRGVRPVLHYSYSRCEHLPQVDDVHNDLHDIRQLLDNGHKKQKLRAHSDYFPNRKANDWALSFWDNFDIQCEAKAKNLASQELYLQATAKQ